MLGKRGGGSQMSNSDQMRETRSEKRKRASRSADLGNEDCDSSENSDNHSQNEGRVTSKKSRVILQGLDPHVIIGKEKRRRSQTNRYQPEVYIRGNPSRSAGGSRRGERRGSTPKRDLRSGRRHVNYRESYSENSDDDGGSVQDFQDSRRVNRRDRTQKVAFDGERYPTRSSRRSVEEFEHLPERSRRSTGSNRSSQSSRQNSVDVVAEDEGVRIRGASRQSSRQQSDLPRIKLTLRQNSKSNAVEDVFSHESAHEEDAKEKEVKSDLEHPADADEVTGKVAVTSDRGDEKDGVAMVNHAENGVENEGESSDNSTKHQRESKTRAGTNKRSRQITSSSSAYSESHDEEESAEIEEEASAEDDVVGEDADADTDGDNNYQVGTHSLRKRNGRNSVAPSGMNLRSNKQRRHSQQKSSHRSVRRSTRSRQMDDEPRSEENGRPKRNRAQVSYVPFFPPLDADAERANAASQGFGRAFGRDSRGNSRNQPGYRPGGMAAKTTHMAGSSDDEGATPGPIRGSSARLDGLRSLPALSGIKSGLAPLNIGDLKRAQDKLISEALGVEGFADTEREARLVKASGGKDLADTDPLAGERTTFEMIGGLQEHIQTLKEMVVMPLMYPEIFANFKIKPPRGVLFYGPPGTGKTLMARALAGSCSTNQQRVAFFMRKGADVMSKWVGESERQLRLLFDQARAFQPSIIFFDEIDGLAPVRSSKQDQVHASIVSTLLALMDGLDSRGQVVVIGATNRIDAIDPALRRPGRFDREFYFPLPSEAARKQIIDIATQEWKPPLDDDLKLHLAKETRNYCGADVKALCTEAALNAVRRTYPQIYFSENKLLLDVGSIEVRTEDFSRALHAIVPNSNRTSVARSQPIPSHIAPLLKSNNKALQSALDQIVPTMKLLAKKLANVTSQSSGNPEIKSGASSSSLASLASGESYTEAQGSSNTFLSYFKTFQPRILIAGEPGMGQKYLGPAALAQLENHKFHITALDLASLHGDSTKTPEATVVQAFGEARRHRLSVIYVPHADQWWMNTSEVAKSNFQNLLAMEPRQQPILLLATSETPVENMSGKFRKVFLEEGLGIGTMEPGLVALTLPNDSERRAFFEPLLADIRHPSIVANKAGTFAIDDAPTLVQKSADMPELPLAPPPPPHKLTPQELEAVRQSDDVLLAQLRKELRAIMSNLKGYRTMFRTPWFEQNYPEYFDEGQHALTLDVIDEKIDVHYLTPEEWYDDVKTMTDEIAHLFPHRLASKAHALRDEVFLTRNSFTDEFRYDCKMMSIRRREARKKEAEHRRKAEEENAIQVDEGSTVRSSRRLRGEEPVIVEPNEDVVEIEDDDERLCISRSKGKAPAMSATPDATTGADECILQAVGVEEGRLKSPHDFDENFFIPPTTERAEVADQISEMEIDDEPPKEIIPSSSPVHRAEIEVRQAVASEANQADAAIVSETVVIGGPSVAVEDSDKSSAPEPVSLEPELTFVIEEEEVQAFADILVQRTTGLGLGEVEAVAVTLASLLTRMTRVEQRAHVVRELQAELQRMCARS